MLQKMEEGFYISDHSNVTVHKSATVKFTHNRANRNGGAIFISNYSSMVFNEHHMYILQQCFDDKPNVRVQYLTRSLITVKFYNNTANEFGGDIFVNSSNIIFGDSTDVKFDGNCYIYNCLSHNISRTSTVHIANQSIIIFRGSSTAIFSNYNYSHNGSSGLMYIVHYSTITFEGNTTVNFIDNHFNFHGDNGGLMYTDDSSNITFKGNSTVNFTENHTNGNGGLIYIGRHSTIIFDGSTAVNFMNNLVNGIGGVMYNYGEFTTITFQGNSFVKFSFNDVDKAVMYIFGYSTTITFQDNSSVNFIYNYAATSKGGLMYMTDFDSNITFKGNCSVNFIYNIGNGGVMYIACSYITFTENSTVNFTENHTNGSGLIYIDYYSTIIFEGSTTVNFFNNLHYHGNGAVVYIDGYSVFTNITFRETLP